MVAFSLISTAVLQRALFILFSVGPELTCIISFTFHLTLTHCVSSLELFRPDKISIECCVHHQAYSWAVCNMNIQFKLQLQTKTFKKFLRGTYSYSLETKLWLAIFSRCSFHLFTFSIESHRSTLSLIAKSLRFKIYQTSSNWIKTEEKLRIMCIQPARSNVKITT